jgi:hypothetical protein
VKQAGLEPWPRLFHNLRSSRETELLEQFPVHVVAQWMGHDAKVSLKHYAQTKEEHFDLATGGAKSGAEEAQNQAQQVPARNRRDEKQSSEVDIEGDFTVTFCDSPRDTAHVSSGEGGIRTSTENPGENASCAGRNVKSNVRSIHEPDLSLVIEEWSRMPEAMKAGILAMIRALGN